VMSCEDIRIFIQRLEILKIHHLTYQLSNLQSRLGTLTQNEINNSNLSNIK
jgi:hypothetical protein